MKGSSLSGAAEPAWPGRSASPPRGGDAEGGAGGVKPSAAGSVKPTDAETLGSGPMSFGLFQREQRSLFGEILDWMLTPLLLLWPLSLALTWRPLTSQNVVVRLAAAALVPGAGYKDLYGPDLPYSILANLVLAY